MNVFLDGVFAFSLQRVTAAWLKTGQVLDEGKIENLRAQDFDERAYQKTLQFLSHRMRSEAEIERKLSGDGFEPSLVTKVIDRLRSDGLVNDDHFAQVWVEDRASLHPRSRRVMTIELKQKGIADEMIQTALSHLASEEVLAYELATKRYHRYENLDWILFRARLGSFLGRKGFSYDVIDSILKRVWSENHEINEI